MYTDRHLTMSQLLWKPSQFGVVAGLKSSPLYSSVAHVDAQ